MPESGRWLPIEHKDWELITFSSDMCGSLLPAGITCGHEHNQKSSDVLQVQQNGDCAANECSPLSQPGLVIISGIASGYSMDEG